MSPPRSHRMTESLSCLALLLLGAYLAAASHARYSAEEET